MAEIPAPRLGQGLSLVNALGSWTEQRNLLSWDLDTADEISVLWGREKKNRHTHEHTDKHTHIYYVYIYKGDELHEVAQQRR